MPQDPTEIGALTLEHNYSQWFPVQYWNIEIFFSLETIKRL